MDRQKCCICYGDEFEWVCVQFVLIRFMVCCYPCLLAKQWQQTISNKNTDNFNGNEAK